MTRCGKAALWYREKYGYSVIPTIEKIACVKWAKYSQEKASVEQITEWFNKFPNANVAICTGKVSGITVLDIDSAAGLRSLGEFMPDSLEVPIVQTPAKGRTDPGYHYYLQYVPGIANKARILNGVDVRNDGGYVLAPPSMGGLYKWLA